MPLVNTLVFSLIFARVAAIDTGMPYPLYAYSGLLAWNFGASSLRFAVTSLTSNANLVSKVYFPREIFPFSAVLVALVDTCVGSLLLLAMMAWYGAAPGATVLLLPVILAIHLALIAGLSLALAMAHLFFRDVKYLFDIVLNAGMFATAVVYPVSGVGGRVGAVLALNPLTVILDGYRAVLLRHAMPDLAALSWVACGSVGLLAISWSMFHRTELRFAENI
jgi:ABC-2 type transport system permease protein/lipopolysaccharide transport system permease protein